MASPQPVFRTSAKTRARGTPWQKPAPRIDFDASVGLQYETLCTLRVHRRVECTAEATTYDRSNPRHETPPTMPEDSADADTSTALSDAGLSKGEIFDVLRNQRRRFVLQYLKRKGEPVELGDLATQVASWEYRTPCEEVSSEQRKRVYTTLQQTHLPRMSEAQIIDYDSDTGLVEPTARTQDSPSTSRSSPAANSRGASTISRSARSARPSVRLSGAASTPSRSSRTSPGRRSSR